jgi:flavin reductase (DIM6/NTAB) family NADH-FMN oxidoreductase RutF
MDSKDAIALLRNADPIVWLVTAQSGPRKGGLVATWVHETSLDNEKPRLLVGLAPHHNTTELVLERGRLVLHQISPPDMEEYWSFCTKKGREFDKFADLQHRKDPFGLPRLEPCNGYLSCKVMATKDTGDRVYLWCDVEAGEKFSEAPPLRQSQLFALAGEERIKKLREDRERDAQQLRPLFEAWLDT